MVKHFSKILISCLAGLTLAWCVVGTAMVLARPSSQVPEITTKENIPPIKKAQKTKMTTNLTFNDSTADTDALATYGYKWTAATRTLTLDGLNMDLTGVSVKTGIVFNTPSAGEQAYIVLADGSTNTIIGGYSSDFQSQCIFSYMNIKVTGNGNLNLTAHSFTEAEKTANPTATFKSNGYLGYSLEVGSGTDNPHVTVKSGNTQGGNNVASVANSLQVNSGYLHLIAAEDTGTSHAINSASTTASYSITVNGGDLLMTGATKAVNFAKAPTVTTTTGISYYGSEIYNDTTRAASGATYDTTNKTYTINGNIAKTLIFQAVELTLDEHAGIPAQPAATYDFTLETYLNLAGSATFSISYYSDLAGSSASTAPATTQLEITYSFTKTDGSQTFSVITKADTIPGSYYISFSYGSVKSNIIAVEVIKADQATPTYSIDFSKELLTGYDSTNYEYSISGDFTDSASCTADLSTAAGFSSLISSSADVTVYVRKKGTTQYNSSAAQTITLPKRTAAPAATFNATSETNGTLADLDNTMEYSINGGTDWVKVTGTDTTADLTLSSGAVLIVRTAATSTAFSSVEENLGTISKAAALTGTYVFTAASDSTGTLDGVDDTMEYTTDGGSNWVKVTTGATSVDLTGLAAENHIEVRVAAKGTVLASAAKDVATLTKATAPTTGTFAATSDTTGTLTGVTDTMEYTTDGGTTWTKVTAGSTSVDFTGLAAGDHIEVRVAANGSVLASTAKDVATLTKATAPTTGTFAATSDTEGTLTGVDDTMEYTTDGGTTWTKVTTGATSVDLTGLAAGDHIEVRVAAKGTVLASSAKDVATLTKATAPTTGTFTATSDTTGTLTGVNDTMEYTTDGGTTWVKVTTGATSVDLTGLTSSSHIEVRVAATGSVLASTAKDVATLTKATAPTTGVFTATSDTTGTLTGVNDTMEYTIDGGTTWVKVTAGATSVDLTGLTAGNHIEVRVAVNGSILASTAKDIATLTKATAPTTGVFTATSDTTGTLTGVNDTMEYTTDGGTAWIKVTAGATSVDLTGIDTNSHIEVRVAATGTALASTAQDLGKPTQATAPTTGNFAATSDTE
ncbi:MAG: hypothetical protein LKJ88_07500, partial [Bacilli bacterium]|nr:hypothetical protein [Bacilli bacterium]